MSSPFSNSKKILASNVTSRILGDFDDPLPGIIAGAAVTGQDLTKEIVDYFSGGLFNKTEKFYRYGRDHFVRGLPEQVTYDTRNDYSEFKRILSGINGGAPVQILYLYIDPDPSSEHHVLQYLQDVRLRNPVTNIIGNKTGLGLNSGIVLTYAEYVRDPDVFMSGNIKYTYEDNSEEAVIYEDPPNPPNDVYIWQCAYQLLNPTTSEPIPGIKYFSYQQGLGTYPTLDAPSVVGKPTPSEYYPIIPFYEDKFQVGDIANKGTPLYDTSKKAIQLLGLDYRSIVQQLHEGTEDSIGEDKGLYAYLTLSAEVTAGIPKFADLGKSDAEKLKILKEAQPTLNYLIEYFLELEKHQQNDMKYWELTDKYIYVTQLPDKNMIEIRDESYKQRIYFTYIHSEVKSGVIGEKDWCTNTYVRNTKTSTTFVVPAVEDIDTSILENQTLTVNYSTLTYKKQISEDSYLQVVVDGLYQIMTVFRDTDAGTALPNTFIETDPTLVTIPLHRPTVLKIKRTMRNRLMHNSLMFTFNSYAIQEIKWYQSKFWGYLVMVIAVVFALPTGGQSLTWGQVFSAAFLKAAARAFLTYVFKYLIFRELVKYIADRYGAEAAFIVALAAMAYGKFGTKGGGAGVQGLPFADQALQAGLSIWSSTNEYLQDKLQDIQKDYAKLESETEKLNKELEEAKKLLDNKAVVDPWLFVNPLPDLLFAQTPDEYRISRINTNPGLITLQSPSNYTRLMLTLPTIDDSIHPSV